MGTYKKTSIQIKHHGRNIFGVLYLPESTEKCPLAIFCHGFNGTHTDFFMHCDFLASHGIAGLCFDFCGGSVNSKSDLQTSEMSLFTEKEDLTAVMEYAKALEIADNDNLFVFGASQGGMVAALTADDYQEDIKGLLLQYPALCIPDDWNKKYPTTDSIPDTTDLWGVTLGKVYFETIHGFDVWKHIGKYNKNVFIFHGDQDQVVPLSYGEKAAKVYPHANIEIFRGEGHGFSESQNQRVIEMTYEFIKSNSLT